MFYDVIYDIFIETCFMIGIVQSALYYYLSLMKCFTDIHYNIDIIIRRPTHHINIAYI